MNTVLTMYTVFELLLATYRDYQEIFKKQKVKTESGNKYLSELKVLVLNQIEILTILNKEGSSVKLVKPLLRSLLILGRSTSFARANEVRQKLLKNLVFMGNLGANTYKALTPRL